MKLHYTASSPYSRKALIVADECGLKGRIEIVPTNPHESAPEFVARNPFSKIPTLVLDDGSVLFESSLICEYFDELGGGGRVLPKAWPQRLAVLRKHAFATGLMDASVQRRVESLRATEADREKNMARQLAVTRRGLDRLEAGDVTLDGAVDLGNIAIAVSLAYLDFRFSSDRWREGRPKLARWFEQYASRPSFTSTVPQ